jgi:uncharacterized protein (DUF1697 family)
MAAYVALLRAINLGSTNKVAMADLRACTEELGFDDVRTHALSGNVVFTGPKRSADAIAKQLHTAYSDRFGFSIPVMVRTAAQLANIVADNPLAAVADNASRQLVYFLANPVAAGRLADLDPAELAPEAWALRGRELHAWIPDGQQRSRLAALLTTKRLGTEATARTWRVVGKLSDMTGN